MVYTSSKWTPASRSDDVIQGRQADHFIHDNTRDHGSWYCEMWGLTSSIFTIDLSSLNRYFFKKSKTYSIDIDILDKQLILQYAEEKAEI